MFNEQSADGVKVNTGVAVITPKSPTVEEEQFPSDMTTMQCFWKVTTIASPIVFSMLVYLFVQLVNTFFVGKMDEPALLAGVGMGNMLINVLAFAVMQGLNGAIETFVSKEYGRKNYRACGLYLNRGKMVCTVIMIPIIVIFACSDKILVGIGQDAAISHIAKRYCCIMIPGVWAMGMFDATRKFLSS